MAGAGKQGAKGKSSVAASKKKASAKAKPGAKGAKGAKSASPKPSLKKTVNMGPLRGDNSFPDSKQRSG